MNNKYKDQTRCFYKWKIDYT